MTEKTEASLGTRRSDTTRHSLLLLAHENRVSRATEKPQVAPGLRERTLGMKREKRQLPAAAPDAHAHSDPALLARSSQIPRKKKGCLLDGGIVGRAV